MSLSTFYGGRPGQDFVIKKEFKTVEDMAKAFSLGPDYKEVWFGEHCIISSNNLNNPQNGQIYRRGTNYQGNLGGAIYVGRIAGPQSGVPNLEIVSQSELKDNIPDDRYTYFQIQEEDGESTAVYGMWGPSNEGEEEVAVSNVKTVADKVVVKTATVDNEGLVSGKNATGIEYSWINVSNPTDSTEPSVIRFAIKIPYPYFEARAESVSPYKEGKIDFNKTIEATDEIVDGYPFSHILSFKIPHGIHGNQFSNFRVVDNTGKNGTTVFEHFSETGELVGSDTYDNKCFFAATFIEYSSSEVGTKHEIYLGDYDKIAEIIYDNATAELKVNYSNDKEEVVGHIPYITSATVSDKGILMLGRNYGEGITATGAINYIKEIRLTSDYHLQVLFSDEAFDKVNLNDRVKWVTEDGEKWLDLGEIKDTHGLLVGTEYSSDNTGEALFAELKADERFSSGYQNGKVVAVTHSNGDKEICAYDYQTNEWFSLGTLVLSTNAVIIDKNTDATLENGTYTGLNDSRLATLSSQGIAFVHVPVTLQTFEDLVPAKSMGA